MIRFVIPQDSVLMPLHKYGIVKVRSIERIAGSIRNFRGLEPVEDFPGTRHKVKSNRA